MAKSRQSSRLLSAAAVRPWRAFAILIGLIPRMYDFQLEFWPNEVAEFLKNGGYDEAHALNRHDASIHDQP